MLFLKKFGFFYFVVCMLLSAVFFSFEAFKHPLVSENLIRWLMYPSFIIYLVTLCLPCSEKVHNQFKESILNFLNLFIRIK